MTATAQQGTATDAVAWDHRTPLGSAVTGLLPVALMAVSWAIWAFSAEPPKTPGRLAAAAGTTVLILALRAVGEVLARRTPNRTPLWTVGWGIHAAAMLILVVINPYACIYAFAGYIDGERFLSERFMFPAVVVTASISAVGQVGGPPGIVAAPQLFVGLLVINIVIAGAMMRLAMERERNVRARLETAQELTRVHQVNVDLQDSLLSQERQRGAAAERERLSRDIHDTVAQGLVAVITQLESVPDTVDDDARRRIDRAEQAARSSLAEARRAVHALASPLLDEQDLPAALNELTRTWAHTHEIPTRFEQDGAAADSPHADVLIKITQEALSNVGRHAEADQVAVTLTSHSDELRVDIHDDGRGFDLGRERRGHGLTSMRDRVNAVGGSLTVETSPLDGCTISAAVPR